jgi:hypothetical protein
VKNKPTPAEVEESEIIVNGEKIGVAYGAPSPCDSTLRGKIKIYDNLPFLEEKHPPIVEVTPNMFLRLDAIAQGIKKSNPYLEKDALFPLLYSLRAQEIPILEQHRKLLIAELRTNLTFLISCSRAYFASLPFPQAEVFLKVVCETNEKHPLALHWNLLNADNVRFTFGEFHKAMGYYKVETSILNFESGERELIPFDAYNDQHCEDLAVSLLSQIIDEALSKGGAELNLISKAATLIDKKGRHLEKEEIDFLDSIKGAFMELYVVPSQKSVRTLFLATKNWYTPDQFKRIRNRLGFRWLPTASSGRPKG